MTDTVSIDVATSSLGYMVLDCEYLMVPRPWVSCFVRSLMLAACFLFWVTSSSLSSSTRVFSCATSACSAVRASCKPCTSCCLSTSSCLSCRDCAISGDEKGMRLIMHQQHWQSVKTPAWTKIIIIIKRSKQTQFLPNLVIQKPAGLLLLCLEFREAAGELIQLRLQRVALRLELGVLAAQLLGEAQ